MTIHKLRILFNMLLVVTLSFSLGNLVIDNSVSENIIEIEGFEEESEIEEFHDSYLNYSDQNSIRVGGGSNQIIIPDVPEWNQSIVVNSSIIERFVDYKSTVPPLPFYIRYCALLVYS